MKRTQYKKLKILFAPLLDVYQTSFLTKYLVVFLIGASCLSIAIFPRTITKDVDNAIKHCRYFES